MSITSCMTPAAFAKLPRAEKAVLVAQDVIDQIRLENIKVTNGEYFNFVKPKNLFKSKRKYDSWGGSWTEYIADKTIANLSVADDKGVELINSLNCKVCAKGALFLSAIKNSNAMAIQELVDITAGQTPENSMAKKVCSTDNIFTKENFDLIEAAFEGWVSHYKNGKEDWRGRIFSNKYHYLSYTDKEGNETAIPENKCAGFDKETSEQKSSNRCLVAICLNIIANKGTFKPGKNDPSFEAIREALKPPVNTSWKKQKRAKNGRFA